MRGGSELAAATEGGESASWTEGWREEGLRRERERSSRVDFRADCGREEDEEGSPERGVEGLERAVRDLLSAGAESSGWGGAAGGRFGRADADDERAGVS